MLKSIHTILFDVGGTLLGSDDLFEKIAEEMNDDRIDANLIAQKFVAIKEAIE